MGILDGFAMLNQSIRQIRTDRQQHDQRMAGLKLEKDKLDAQMQDPRNKLARLQAARQMEEVPISFKIGEFDNDRDRQFFNMYSKPAIEGVLDDEGMMLSEDGRITEKGSSATATRPRFVAQTLANKLALANQASQLGHSKLDMDIDLLTKEIYDSKKKHPASSKHPKDKMYNIQTRLKEEKLAKLVEKRNDPQQKLNRLVETNQRITDMQLAAMSDPNIDDKFYARLNNIQTSTNNEIKTLLSQGASAKNLKAVKYTAVDPKTGVVTEQEMYFPGLKANAAPQFYNAGGMTFYRGSQSNFPDTNSGTGTESIKPAQWQSINNRFAQAKDKMLAAAIRAKGEEYVKDILASGDDAEETERLMKLISTDPELVQENWYQVVQADLRNYGHDRNFVGYQGERDKKESGVSRIDVDAFRSRLEANRKK